MCDKITNTYECERIFVCPGGFPIRHCGVVQDVLIVLVLSVKKSNTEFIVIKISQNYSIKVFS